ncbi:MAG: hypothetical protein N2C12_09100 [Planctomycetales bacterium]
MPYTFLLVGVGFLSNLSDFLPFSKAVPGAGTDVRYGSYAALQDIIPEHPLSGHKRPFISFRNTDEVRVAAR